MTVFVDGRRNVSEQHVEQRRQVVGELVWSQSRAARSSIAVHDRKLDLALVRVEVEKQLVHLVDHFVDARVRPIDLVDHEHHGQVRLEGLPQHEARLRQRTLARVHEQQHAVDHRERPLHLTAEVRVSRRVDDVDLDVAKPDCCVLGQNRDALFPFEIHRIEDAVGNILVLSERASLPEHGVDERRLAMVDVGDDRDVTEILAGGHSTRVAAAQGFAGASRLLPCKHGSAIRPPGEMSFSFLLRVCRGRQVSNP